MIFGRVKSLDAILATAEKKSLHRSLGAFQLTMLGIGAVIGTGIVGVCTAAWLQREGCDTSMVQVDPQRLTALAILFKKSLLAFAQRHAGDSYHLRPRNLNALTVVTGAILGTMVALTSIGAGFGLVGGLHMDTNNPAVFGLLVASAGIGMLVYHFVAGKSR